MRKLLAAIAMIIAALFVAAPIAASEPVSQQGALSTTTFGEAGQFGCEHFPYN
jgi:hypothetical protein